MPRVATARARHGRWVTCVHLIKATESTIANQLGQITADVADSKDEAGYASAAARLRVAASVFGF
jgi:hypothetical protein